MKKTILKRVIFVIILSLQMVQGHAQAYEFDRGGQGFFTSESIFLGEKKRLRFSINFVGKSREDGMMHFWFQASDNSSKYIFLGSLIDENKDNNVLKLYLSNGEVLTSPVFGNAFWFTFVPDMTSSNKAKNDKEGIYVMTQLRKYNITKMNLNGQDYTTPKFRSAATIDAMCKKLEKDIFHIWPQLIPLLGSAPTGSSTTSKKTTTNRSSSSSSSNYSSSSGGTYTIQKGDVLWNVSKRLLKESGKANPTNGEIMQAMKDIAKANGCKTYDECNNKYFNSRNVGKYIKLPGYLTKTSVKTSDSSSTTSTATSKPSTSSSSSTSTTTTTPSSSSTTTTTPSSSSSTYSSGSTYGGTSSRPSYNYSYKYHEPHKWIGFSIGYVQKQWTSKVDGKRERYGMWEDSKFISGVQAGIRIEPVASFGLGLNTGLFYEYYYTQSKDMYYSDASGSYRGVIQEHALYLPVHLEYRLRITDDFHAFIYGGAGLDYGISAGVEMKDTNDDYVVYENGSLYESDDVENWKRFNASLEYGLGLSYKNVQLNVTRSHGLINMAKDSDNSVKQDKPLMVSLSVMF